jgi:hypothetical protein
MAVLHQHVGANASGPMDGGIDVSHQSLHFRGASSQETSGSVLPWKMTFSP